MTLRRRLVLGLSGMIVLLGLVLAGTGYAIRASLIDQMDDRLVAIAASDRLTTMAAASSTDPREAGDSALVSDLWVGTTGTNPIVTALQKPTQDPALMPALDGHETEGVPVTRGTTSGTATRVRVIVTPLSSGRQLVVAFPMTEIQEATWQIASAVAVAWVIAILLSVFLGMWIMKLGLTPIEEMTRVASSVTEQVASGVATGERVPPTTAGTEVARLGEAINGMLDASNAARRREYEFVADASHELRTPLTTLRGYSALYAAGALQTPEQVADAMRRINAEASRMATLVDTMLDLSALDAGQPLDMGVVALEPVLEDAASDLRAVDPDRTIDVDMPTPLTAYADGPRLQQALMALGTNALKYGGTHITLGAVRASEGIRITVTDDGPGIPVDELDAIFDRFHRASPSTVRGTGLGLPLVAAIAHAHHGQAGVESTLGAGSTFWIWIPSHTPGPEHSA